MNYRHAFHAGNHADVFKHLVLSRICSLLQEKEVPYAYLESHAGIGLYDLSGEEARRSPEHHAGITKLWAHLAEQPACAAYQAVLQALNPAGGVRYYPGSPEWVRRLSRAQDRLYLNEKHLIDGALLKEQMRSDSRVAVHIGDGWRMPRALLPTLEKRVLCLIDPPFEVSAEWQWCVQALAEILARIRQAIVVIWYPVKDPGRLTTFYRALERSAAPTLLRAEIQVAALDTQGGPLYGSGLVISNPPWRLVAELETLLPWLADRLAITTPAWRLDWLIAEH